MSGDTTALQSAEPLPVFELDREPLPFGTLVGREESVERVERALALRVPVVVTGARGTGKTRLATEIASRGRLQDQDVAWVDLHNMEFRTGWFDTEIERSSRRHPGGLVVIDNAESNVEAAVEAVRSVRRVAIDVGVVVTSRVPLPIDAVVERLGTLGLPDGTSDDAIEAANGSVSCVICSPRVHRMRWWNRGWPPTWSNGSAGCRSAFASWPIWLGRCRRGRCSTGPRPRCGRRSSRRSWRC